MAKPATQRIGTPFGRKGSHWAAGYHTGVDFLTPTGTSIKAPADSKILHAGRGGWGSAYGIHVIGECKGTDGKTYRWIAAHLSDEDTTVGRHVKLGEHIGDSGATGNVTGPHLHFEVRRSPFGYYNHVNPKVVLDVKGSAGPVDKMDPSAYFIGANGPHVTWLGERLVEHGFDDHYSAGPGPTFSEADRKNIEDFQRAQGWSGAAADGFPGPETLKRLAAAPKVTVPTKPTEPTVTHVIPRSEWTSTENGREDRPLSVSKVTAFTVHYPADGDVNYRNLTEAEVASRLRAYRESHLGRGWADIGYNYAIDQSGRVWFLTGDTVGAHSGEAGNPTSIGVLFVIGNNESPTPAAIAAFRSLRASKLEKFTKATKVQGHQQVPGNSTACPGSSLMALIRAGTLSSSAPVVVDPEPQPEPQPEPEPQPKPAAEFRVLNINVGADYVGGYGNRLDELEAVRNEARASLVFTCESGNYADGERLNREFGWGGKRGESFILHGGSVPITTAIHWDPSKYKLVDEGQFVTVPGTTHRWATWVKLEHRDTGQRFVCAASHLQYLPKGPNDIRKYDKEREAQLGAVLKKVEDLADGLPAIVAGDFNGKRTDAYDGPGKAMDRYGYTDPGTGKALIDRFAIKRATVLQHTVLPTQGGTDHPHAAAILVRLDTK